MAKDTKTDQLSDLPKVLSIKRSINLTDALMRACSLKEHSTEKNIVKLFETAKPIDSFRHGQRVTHSYDSEKDPGTSEKGDDPRNLCYGEMAVLPSDTNTLLVQFSGTFLPVSERIDQCDKIKWVEALQSAYPILINRSCRHVASCYAYHLCSGIWLWRNREDSESVSVVVEYGDHNENRIEISEALDIPIHAVQPAGNDGETNYKTYGKNIDGFDVFANKVHDALAGEIKNKISAPTGLHFRVTASCKMKRRQMVHPSQLFLPIKETVGKSGVGRVYYKIDGGAVGITYAKLGNALRRFDRSHGYKQFRTDILPTEPNGGSLNRAVNMRNSKNTFYDYMKSVIAKGANEINKLSLDETAYILGVLIRGGVFV